MTAASRGVNDSRSLVHWLAGFCLLGGITAALLIIAFSQTMWGAPGTAAYQSYELLNRLMAAALLLMAAGWLGVFLVWPQGLGRWAALLAFAGSLIMAAGTAAEFWLFSDQAYGQAGALRNAAWSAFGVGSLLLDIGATVLGVAAWRSQLWPRWVAVILIGALPIDLAAFLLLGSPFLAAALLALVIGLQLVNMHALQRAKGRLKADG
jgi:hypothetical protein